MGIRKEFIFVGQVMAQPGGDAVLLRREEYDGQEGREFLWHHTGIQSFLYPDESFPELADGEIGVGPLKTFTITCECDDVDPGEDVLHREPTDDEPDTPVEEEDEEEPEPS